MNLAIDALRLRGRQHRITVQECRGELVHHRLEIRRLEEQIDNEERAIRDIETALSKLTTP